MDHQFILIWRRIAVRSLRLTGIVVQKGHFLSHKVRSLRKDVPFDTPQGMDDPWRHIRALPEFSKAPLLGNTTRGCTLLGDKTIRPRAIG